MTHLLLVGAGGFFGAICRYLVSGWVHRILPFPGFPYGTLAVNILGCFFIGLLAGLAETRAIITPEARLFIFLGFLGSFTTYSTFGYETLALAGEAENLKALANIALHITVGMGAVWLGGVLSRIL